MIVSSYKISQFDIFYISYDEPNAEKNWADLLSKAPWAKRVHGVKGFDEAHRTCGRSATTHRTVTVDGDNIVEKAFFDQSIVIGAAQENFVFSWSANNIVNGLQYGNGGLKLWPKAVLENLSSHEYSNSSSAVDFCWDLNYFQMNNCYSQVHPNETPFQAFRAGFREGVKMTLDRGEKFKDRIQFFNKIHRGNYQRLCIWCSVGADVDNGLWAIYGARLGCYMTNLTDWDFSLIKDYDWFEQFWQKFAEYSKERLTEENAQLGVKLRDNLKLSVVDLDSDQSRFIKYTYINPLRRGVMTPEVVI
jgi:hypothetical protein